MINAIRKLALVVEPVAQSPETRPPADAYTFVGRHEVDFKHCLITAVAEPGEGSYAELALHYLGTEGGVEAVESFRNSNPDFTKDFGSHVREVVHSAAQGEEPVQLLPSQEAERRMYGVTMLRAMGSVQKIQHTYERQIWNAGVEARLEAREFYRENIPTPRLAQFVAEAYERYGAVTIPFTFAALTGTGFTAALTGLLERGGLGHSLPYVSTAIDMASFYALYFGSLAIRDRREFVDIDKGRVTLKSIGQKLLEFGKIFSVTEPLYLGVRTAVQSFFMNEGMAASNASHIGQGLSLAALCVAQPLIYAFTHRREPALEPELVVRREGILMKMLVSSYLASSVNNSTGDEAVHSGVAWSKVPRKEIIERTEGRAVREGPWWLPSVEEISSNYPRDLADVHAVLPVRTYASVRKRGREEPMGTADDQRSFEDLVKLVSPNSYLKFSVDGTTWHYAQVDGERDFRYAGFSGGRAIALIHEILPDSPPMHRWLFESDFDTRAPHSSIFIREASETEIKRKQIKFGVLGEPRHLF